jgi:hypothetical protein
MPEAKEVSKLLLSLSNIVLAWGNVFMPLNFTIVFACPMTKNMTGK